MLNEMAFLMKLWYKLSAHSFHKPEYQTMRLFLELRKATAFWLSSLASLASLASALAVLTTLAAPTATAAEASERIGDFSLLDAEGYFHQISWYDDHKAVVLLSYADDDKG